MMSLILLICLQSVFSLSSGDGEVGTSSDIKQIQSVVGVTEFSMKDSHNDYSDRGGHGGGGHGGGGRMHDDRSHERRYGPYLSDEDMVGTVPNVEQAQDFVAVHNFYRASVNPPAFSMQAIAWKASLATSANNWAVQCKFAHSGAPGLGENLYATTLRTPVAGDFSPYNAVNAWGIERIYYNYATNTCAANKQCGHYTQVVWNTSLSVGCAFQDCNTIAGLNWTLGGTIVVCQYSPQGNWIGKRPY